MAEGEFNPILAVHKGLPPGLWLPTAEESPDRFRVENFNHTRHDFEDVVDLGAFAVALLVLDAPRSGRTTLMPKREDFDALYTAGYGLGRRQAVHYGGPTKIHDALGFYTKHTADPSKDELTKRISWLSRYSLNPQVEFPDNRPNVTEIIKWGRDRNLLPPLVVIKTVLPNFVEVVRDIFSIEVPRYREQNTYMNAYRLGARVLRDKGRAIPREQLDTEYSDACVGVPSGMIHTFFGSYGAFWEEFGLIAEASWMSQKQRINAGIRHAIATNHSYLSRSQIDTLSKQQKLPNTWSLTLGEESWSIATYQEAVKDGFRQYEALRAELQKQGISNEVCKLACQRFDTSPGFSSRLKKHTHVLVELSQNNQEASYIRQLIGRGFDLLDDEIYKMQVKDFRKFLGKLGLRRENNMRFILDLIPRVNVDEFLYTKNG